MNFLRSSGILLHPTSLPSRFGVGDFGEAARRFVDFLAAAGQSLWQVLPLGPTGYGDSPYQCFSAFAGNTLLVSPDLLARDNLLSADEVARVPTFPAARVDYGKVIKFKAALLERAHARFRHSANQNLRAAYETFCERSAAWLNDYALFRAIKDARGGKAWNEWEQPLARRDTGALARAAEELREQVGAQKFYQFLFFRQWGALKSYANERGVRVVGDLPIFVARDSTDVWAQPAQFKLDGEGNPRVVAGVPPDFFSKTGQLWGNPIYDWERMRADDFRWWVARVRASLELFDVLRIDHFRGFAAAWEVPGTHQTAEHGRWVAAPGRELFAAVRRALGEAPIIAEDLGVITPDVEALRDGLGFPGMRVLQFAFGGDSRNLHLPHNYRRDSVVYTGTHDNDTTAGWFESAAGENSTRDAAQVSRERKFCLAYLDSDGKEIHWDFIRAALASISDTAIVPAQDVLGLGADARMNLPASTEGNWNWRLRDGMLTDELSRRLREMTELYGRIAS